jgi:ATP-dependent protease ClpP protease subunit
VGLYSAHHKGLEERDNYTQLNTFLKATMLALTVFMTGCTAPLTASATDLASPETTELLPEVTPESTPLPEVVPTHKKVKTIQIFTVDQDRMVPVIDSPNTGIDENMADAFSKQLYDLDKKDSKKEIDVVIRSGGGDVMAGGRMIEAMDATKAPIVCVVDEYAYSMAAILLEHCDKRYVQKYADVLFHEAAFQLHGQETYFGSEYTHMIRWLNVYEQDVADRLGLPLGEYKTRCSHEWWLTAEEAVDNKAADAVVIGLKYDYTPAQAQPSIFSLPF